ncbi:MAG TPA: SPASM domain-containing protein, partial [Sedimentisphaerales bacterium]|nr:SPASM domain-containing protein [Sedimentisphaerales bacterium]
YGIADMLYEGAKQQDVTLNLELITNGLLLTQKVVDRLVPLGLRWAKITIDGDRDTHDRMRPHKCLTNGSNGGTYDKIIENLKDIRGRIPLIIGGNYDQSTKDSIPVMLDDLIAHGFKAEHFKKIAFKPILAFPGHQVSSAHIIEACTYADTNMEDFFWLIGETEKRGLPSYKKLGLGPCEAMRDNTYTIDPDGDIYKCAAMAGRKEFSIGNIENELEEILFSSQNIAYIMSDAWKQCKKCPFVPLCGGGCRLGAVSATGSFDAIACEREYFDKISTKLVVDESLAMISLDTIDKYERR